MGTDIHWYVEVKKGVRWTRKRESKKHPNLWMYQGRNYSLFAALAGVENRFLGDSIEPISEPRGIPLNISKALARRAEDSLDWAHGHSYLYLEEIQEYEWEQEQVIREVVPFKAWKEFRTTGTLPEVVRCGWISGPAIKVLSSEEAEEFLKSSNPTNFLLFVKHERIVKLSSQVEFFLTSTLPSLEKLGSPNHVRIVFWFDS